MNKDEALRLALEALGHFEKAGLATLKTIDAITAIKQALEQPEPEPVAWLVTGPYEKRAWETLESAENYCRSLNIGAGEEVYSISPLYTKPKREWQGLTDEEMHECWDSPLTPLGMKHARMIEAKLKEKNT